MISTRLVWDLMIPFEAPSYQEAASHRVGEMEGCIPISTIQCLEDDDQVSTQMPRQVRVMIHLDPDRHRREATEDRPIHLVDLGVTTLSDGFA